MGAELARAYFECGQRAPEGLSGALREGVGWLETEMNRAFGGVEAPLLLSVRASGPTDMPGPMGPGVIVGITDEVAAAWPAEESGFGRDAHLRVLLGLREVLAAQEPDRLEPIPRAEEIEGWIDRLRDELGQHPEAQPWFEDPYAQLERAVLFAFQAEPRPSAPDGSRRRNDSYPAVVVQTLVFGNRDPNSGSGLAFTRDPESGEKRFFGEFLRQAQGEDVVAGHRTPAPLQGTSSSLQAILPDAFAELARWADVLERHHRDMVDISFTVESGKLFLLEAKPGQRTAQAALTVAVDLVAESTITEQEALLRVSPAELEPLRELMFGGESSSEALVRGLPASPGAASGKLAFSVEEVMRRSSEKLILVKNETEAEDVRAMQLVQGILTARGGLTCHAAVVARGLSKPCVVDCRGIQVDETAGVLRAGDQVLGSESIISLDGTSGTIHVGQVQTGHRATSRAYQQVLRWADTHRKLRIRVAAESCDEARVGLRQGAEGVGLFKTDHLFQRSDEALTALRDFVLADGEAARQVALNRIEVLHRTALIELFEAGGHIPVVVALLDPPERAVVPPQDEALRKVAEALGRSEAAIREKAAGLRHENPELGLRGARFGVVMTGLYEAQTRAVMHAAAEVRGRGIEVRPELMFPRVSTPAEFAWLRERVTKSANRVLESVGIQIDYRVGASVDLPRAAIMAERLAETADFLIFGAFELTQTVFGMSKQDTRSFLRRYCELGLVDADPFEVFDVEGVGALIRSAVDSARKSRGSLMMGLSGVHGDDPSAIHFAHRVGLDFVACPPAQVPSARLSAARAAIMEQRESSL